MPLSRDIEDYKQPWESVEHWELRKEFINTHSDEFSENRLLCLAQVYANVELLDCSYPAEVMKQVAALSTDLKLNQEFRKSKAKKLEILFIKESKSSEEHTDSNKQSNKNKYHSSRPPRTFQDDSFDPSGKRKRASNYF